MEQELERGELEYVLLQMPGIQRGWVSSTCLSLPTGKHGHVPVGEGSALPGCHTDTAGLPGIYSWINPSPNPAVGRSASD